MKFLKSLYGVISKCILPFLYDLLFLIREEIKLILSSYYVSGSLQI